MRPAVAARAASAALLAALLAGCSGPAAPAPAAVDPSSFAVPAGQGPLGFDVPWVADVTLPEGRGLTLRLGTGWGQLRLHAEGARLAIGHGQFPSFDPFADPDGAVYVPGVFTAVRLHGADGSGDSFWWLGHEAGFSGPRKESSHEGVGGLDHATGDGALFLTVANSLPGYVLHLNGGGVEADWTLGQHPALVAAWPEPVERGGADGGPVRAASAREWTQPLPGLPPSAIYALSWSSSFGETPVGGARAGVASGGFGIGRAGEEAPSWGTGPHGGFGGYFGGGSHEVEVTREAADMQAALWYRFTDAGTTRTSEGLAVLAMPLAPP